METGIQQRDGGRAVILQAHQRAVAAADVAVDQVAFDVGSAAGKAHLDAPSVDQRIVDHLAACCVVQIDAIVRTGGNQIGPQHAPVLLRDAFAVAAVRFAGGAAAQRQADALARLPEQAHLAQHRVLFEQVIAAAALGEGTVADPVAAAFDKVGDQVAPDAPAARRHQVDRRHRVGHRAHAVVAQRIALYPAVVGKAALVAVDLEVGVEVHDDIVERDEVAGCAGDVKGMFAITLLFAHAPYGQVFKAPVRRRHIKAFAQLQFDLDAAGLLGAQHDVGRFGPCARDVDGQPGKAVAPRQQRDHVARRRGGDRVAHFVADGYDTAPARRALQRRCSAGAHARDDVPLGSGNAAVEPRQRRRRPLADGDDDVVVTSGSLGDIGRQRARRDAACLQEQGAGQREHAAGQQQP